MVLKIVWLYQLVKYLKAYWTNTSIFYPLEIAGKSENYVFFMALCYC